MCIYTLVKVIGRGGFGTIYLGKKDNRSYAVKYQKKNNYPLYYEWKILNKLQKLKCIPKIEKINIDENNYTYFAMQLLDKNLRERYDKLFNQNKLTNIIIKKMFTDMLDCLRQVHDKGVLHGDLKPENFMFDLSGNIYLIDFGLSKFYIYKGNHISFKYVSNTTGSLEFMSLNNHDLQHISRRDDLISLFYNYVHLLIDGLPWSHSKSLKNIKKIKTSVCVEELCRLLHKNFKDFYHYCSQLNFYENPDYNYLFNLIKTMDNIFV